MMERERSNRIRRTDDDEPRPDRPPLDDARENMERLLSAADRALDSLSDLDVEDYLQRNRQQGGQ